MKRTAISLFTLLAAFAAPRALADGKDPSNAGPAYDVATEIQINGSVSGVHETSKGPLAGIYLTVKTRSEPLEVYLGPADFVRMFGVEFKNGDEIEGTGSKVKYDEKDLVLAREVTVGKVTLRLRDAKGSPNWLWLKKVPTGE